MAGYTIPAGWIVAVAPSVVHYNAEIYENPLEFNPWRWEVLIIYIIIVSSYRTITNKNHVVECHLYGRAKICARQGLKH